MDYNSNSKYTEQVYNDLLMLEKYVSESSASEIVQTANYLVNRIKQNVENLKEVSDENLILRYQELIKQVIKSMGLRDYSGKKIIFSVKDMPGIGCGLADKLRGVVTLYSFCKENNIDFFINWVYPNDLRNYLIPNNYNWAINDYEISNDTKITDCDYGNLSINDFLGVVENKLENTDTISVFTNNFYQQKDFGQLFNELFKPVDRLQIGIDFHLKQIGCEYISATFRFQQLLGDFKERDYDPILPLAEREPLINKCINHLTNIFNQNNYKKILVTSDSISFLNKVKMFDFVYVIPGQIAHIGHDHGHNVDVYMKSFLDFYLLTHSKCIYSVSEGKMYDSGFPKVASRINNTKYVKMDYRLR